MSMGSLFWAPHYDQASASSAAPEERFAASRGRLQKSPKSSLILKEGLEA